MTALFPTTSPTIAHGTGHLAFSRVGDSTVITRASATNPLRILTPRPSGKAAWAFTSSFGGGLVAGDHLSLGIDAGPDTTCYVSTQSAAKIYRSVAGSDCAQTLAATVAGNALLVYAPDPVICFAEARYRQHQRFNIASTGGLVLLDWFTSGRHARGERWAFTSCQSRNELFIDSKRVLTDVLHLDAEDGLIDSPLRTGDFNCFAMLVLAGERVRPFSQSILREVAQAPIARRTDLLISAGPLADGVIVRIAAIRTERAAEFLFEKLNFLTDILGEHPWLRKW